MRLSGPMFEPSEHDFGKSIFGKEGAHYNIYKFSDIKTLKTMFPEAQANELNFVLFSTSGIHGSYITIEDLEKAITDNDPDYEGVYTLTVLIIQPRTVTMRYGNIDITAEDLPYLKKLRETSFDAVKTIGVEA